MTWHLVELALPFKEGPSEGLQQGLTVGGRGATLASVPKAFCGPGPLREMPFKGIAGHGVWGEAFCST